MQSHDYASIARARVARFAFTVVAGVAAIFLVPTWVSFTFAQSSATFVDCERHADGTCRSNGAMTESDFRSHPGGLPRNTVLERRASLTARVREFGGNIDTGN